MQVSNLAYKLLIRVYSMEYAIIEYTFGGPINRTTRVQSHMFKTTGKVSYALCHA
jgi:hypothetical protein